MADDVRGFGKNIGDDIRILRDTVAIPPPVTRRRGTGAEYDSSYHQKIFIGPPLNIPISENTYTGSFKTSGTQVTTSEGHNFASSKRKGVTDIGGDFHSTHTYVLPFVNRSLKINYNSPTSGFDYNIGFSGAVLAASPFTQAFDPSPESSSSTLNALGASAIARVKPTNPVVGMTTDLSELRQEGLPHASGVTLWEDKTKSVLNLAGDEYLNVQFGWRPLVNDITGFAVGVSRAHEIIKSYEDGIGKPIRRRYDFPLESSFSSTLVSSSAVPFFGLQGGSDWTTQMCGTGFSPKARAGSLYKEVTTSRKRWFSGSFMYYYPANNVFTGKLKEYAILSQQLGLEITPYALWSAAPWSWAVDWFSNIGDVISNTTSFHEDGLVMAYGYLMEHSIISTTYKLVGCLLNDGTPAPVQDLTFVTETKLRRGANPYGFGLKFGSLSGFQQAIIGALGLSKWRS